MTAAGGVGAPILGSCPLGGPYQPTTPGTARAYSPLDEIPTQRSAELDGGTIETPPPPAGTARARALQPVSPAERVRPLVFAGPGSARLIVRCFSTRTDPRATDANLALARPDQEPVCVDPRRSGTASPERRIVESMPARADRITSQVAEGRRCCRGQVCTQEEALCHLGVQNDLRCAEATRVDGSDSAQSSVRVSWSPPTRAAETL